MIRPSIELDPRLRRFIHERFDKSLETIDTFDVERIQKRLPAIVRGLRSRRVLWQMDLANYAESILAIVIDRDPGEVDEIVWRASYAALYYLCDPFDTVPDYAPGIGFVDDALVINRCLAVIRKRDETAFREICERVPRA